MRKGTFNNIAHLIKTAREKTPWSQNELSYLMGYKNGQFISNIERGLCSLPLKILMKVSEHIKVPPEDIRAALIQDYTDQINNIIAKEEASYAEATSPGPGDHVPSI